MRKTQLVKDKQIKETSQERIWGGLRHIDHDKYSTQRLLTQKELDEFNRGSVNSKLHNQRQQQEQSRLAQSQIQQEQQRHQERVLEEQRNKQKSNAKINLENEV